MSPVPSHVRAAPGRKSPPRLKLNGDPSEDQFQESVANLLDAILPADQVVWTHIAHGGYELSGAARGRLMRLGLKRGFPDIVICYKPGRTLWLECKTRTGRVSIDQKQKHALLWVMGHNVVVVRRIEDVISALELHGVPFRKARLDRSYHGANQGDQGTAPGSAEESTQGAVQPTEAINA